MILIGDVIEGVIIPRTRDLGGFEVRRALPSLQRQMVGPFIFFDQMGPAEFLTGQGVDVRSHPHIGLATVTYLMKGRIRHRDSLGPDARIAQGAVNLMVAGQGITLSERMDEPAKQGPQSLFGLQTWRALPLANEDDPAAFVHAPGADLPVLEGEGKVVRLILGAACCRIRPFQVRRRRLLGRSLGWCCGCFDVVLAGSDTILGSTIGASISGGAGHDPIYRGAGAAWRLRQKTWANRLTPPPRFRNTPQRSGGPGWLSGGSSVG